MTDSKSNFSARLRAASTAALGCCLLAASTSARAGDASGTGTPFAAEVIGTLPSFWVEDDLSLVGMPTPEMTQMQRDLHMETFVPAGSISELVADADGDGYVLLSTPPEFDGVVRMRFYGDVQVRFDRDLVGDLQIPLKLAFGEGNQGGAGLIAVDSIGTSPFLLASAGDGLGVPFGVSPTLDALFEQSAVEFYSAVEAPGFETPGSEGSGFDVGRVALSVGSTFYGFELEVVESLLP